MVGQLKTQLSETTVNVWFDEVDVVTMEDSAFVLHCSNTFKKDIIEKQFIKHIKEHGNLYELRMKYESNIYRVFFIFDGDCIVVLFHGFQKKTQKTPPSEIKKALKIRAEYYDYKKEHDR